MKKDDDITKVKVTGRYKVANYLPEETERRLTNNSYVNTEFEAWSDLKPDRLMPLKDQRRPFEQYFPKGRPDAEGFNPNNNGYQVRDILFRLLESLTITNILRELL